MMTRWQFWVLTVLALLMAALIAANMYRFSDNRKLQTDVNQRAQFIQQSGPIETLSREIAGALAQLGVRTQDEQVRAMLAALGITVTVNTQTPQAGAQERKK